MKAERVVCDTNILISAAIAPRGKPRQVLEHIRSSGQLLMCQAGLVELSSRLARPKFDRYLSPEARRNFLTAIASVAEIVPISGGLRICRDPDDDRMLETAIEGKADCLVTGDGDLLALRPCGEIGTAVTVDDARYQSIAILRPSEVVALAGIS
jgi:hypothetical protein